MSIFDLIFVGCFSGSIGYAFWILSLFVRRRWSPLGRHAIRWVTLVSIYVLVVVSVGSLSNRRVLRVDQRLGYDDWYLGVQESAFVDELGETHPEPGKRFLVVTLKASSTAGREQAAPKGALAYVLDDADNRYDVSDQGQMAFEKLNGVQPDLTAKLEAHGSFLTTRVFAVPRAANAFFIGHRHGTGSRFPGMFIIGTGFRMAPVIRLQIDLGQ